GVGWATAYRASAAPSAEATLTIGEVERTLDDLAAMSGPGSGTARKATLGDLLARATEREGDLLRRLLTGEIRHGALEGIVTEAVARAADVPAPVVRRAAMLAG